MTTETTRPETFPEYLQRVGDDYAEAGSECTAEDYHAAAEKLEAAAEYLRDLAAALTDGDDPDEIAEIMLQANVEILSH